jgi:hypothetical protein
MRKRHIVTCDLTGCTKFFHIVIKEAIFEKKKLLNIKSVL